MSEMAKRYLNKTAEFFYQLSVVTFLLGIKNIWIEELKISKQFIKYYATFSTVAKILTAFFILMEYGAVYTQTNLTVKLQSELYMRCIAHPLFWYYGYKITKHSAEVRRLFEDILKMKEIYNDTQVEEQNVKTAKFQSTGVTIGAFVIVILNTLSALVQVIKSGGPFMPLATAWPPSDDNSVPANIGNAMSAVLYWFLMGIGVSGAIVAISLMITMSCQFMNVQSYFYNLNKIFHKNITIEEMEVEYEKGLITGLKLQVETMRCTGKSRDICISVVFGQMMLYLSVQVALMWQMTRSEKTVNLIPAVCTMLLLLFVTGIFMCNAGDITLEAAKVDRAIFYSGWHNCRRSTLKKLKNIIILSMMKAQEPLILTYCFGIVEISYESYIALIKFSYSTFSVICSLSE